MTSKIPVSRPLDAPSIQRPRSRRGLFLCLLGVLALHVLALREAPGWLARPAAAATPARPGAARSVTTRLLVQETAPEPSRAEAVTPPQRPPARRKRLAHEAIDVANVAVTVAALADTSAASTASASGAPGASSASSGSGLNSTNGTNGTPHTVNAPPPIRLDYKLKRGAVGGDARLDWRHDGRRYTLDLEGQLPLIGTFMHQHSEGGFDTAGLAPLRYTEKRLRRSERAVNFNRPVDGQHGRITFSATTGEAPLRAGAQDRVSWMVQLAARLAGTQSMPAPGSRIDMDVASAGGDVQDWHFVLQGRADDGSWHWRRDTGEPDATQAEVWTDPATGHWPSRVRLTERQGEPIELVLRRR